MSISRLACCSKVWAGSCWPRVSCICAIIRMNSTYLQDVWGRARLDSHDMNHIHVTCTCHSHTHTHTHISCTPFLKHHCFINNNPFSLSFLPLPQTSDTQMHSPSSKQATFPSSPHTDALTILKTSNLPLLPLHRCTHHPRSSSVLATIAPSLA